MELLKPKREETVKQEYEVLKPTRFIFESYSKYEKCTEGEILEYLALQVLNGRTSNQKKVTFIATPFYLNRYLFKSLFLCFHLLKTQVIVMIQYHLSIL